MKGKMFYSYLCVATGLIFFLTAAPAIAQEKGEHQGPSKGHHMEADMAEGEKAAGLTQEQRDKMKALREEFRGKQKAFWDQIKVKREALGKELNSANPDRGKAESMAKEINDLQGNAAISRIDEVFKVRAIMTPEQFQKLRDFHQKQMEKMKGKMKKGTGERWEKGKSGHDNDVMPGEGSNEVK
jgi:Spy/CpxP family protein refolding chaperone